MNITFYLNWVSSKLANQKSFKYLGAYNLFCEYQKKISPFAQVRLAGEWKQDLKTKSGAKLWICDRSKKSRVLSSEDVAKQLEHMQGSAIRDWHIVIGDADGFSANQIESYQPDLCWSFGPMTLPHELALVVASEQVYRAWTILKGLPYHGGH